MADEQMAKIDPVRSALRHAPAQARGTARLTSLLDAAAGVVDEAGLERVTTALVARRAVASIGTVYRYFPDRIAILNALGARNLYRLRDEVSASLVVVGSDTPHSACTRAFAAIERAFRHEPGFRALRTGDRLDIRPAETPQTFLSEIAEVIADHLVDHRLVSESPALRLAIEIALEVLDTLMARAFAREAEGDDRFLDAARRLAFDALDDYVEPPHRSD